MAFRMNRSDISARQAAPLVSMELFDEDQTQSDCNAFLVDADK